jgi:hypothetical protein
MPLLNIRFKEKSVMQPEHYEDVGKKLQRLLCICNGAKKNKQVL